MPLNLNDRVRLPAEPRLGILVVVATYLEGEVPWVLLQRNDGKALTGPKFPRPVADVEVTP